MASATSSTPPRIAEGGYEIECSDVGPGAEDVLVATVIRQVRALKAGRTGQGPCPDPPKKP